MANANWQNGKAKGRNQAKAWLRHNDVEHREEVNHSNPDIRKELTSMNYEVGVTASLSYAQKCKRLDERLDELGYIEGAGKNKRVSIQSVCIYPPDGLLEYDEEMDMYKSTPQLKDWFTEAAKIWEDFAGVENVTGCFVDFDEQHWYRPKGKGNIDPVLSKPHIHSSSIPEIDGRISGKAFSARGRLNDLNNRLEEMTLDKFGISYNNGKGKNEYGSKTVEELKAESERVDKIEEALQDALQTLKESEAENEQLKTENEELSESNSVLQNELANVEEKFQKEYEEKSKKLKEDLAIQIKECQMSFEQSEKALNTHYKQREKELESEYNQKLHDLEVQTNAASRHLEYVKGVADGQEERAVFYQKQAKERRHKSAIAGEELSAKNRMIETRRNRKRELDKAIKDSEKIIDNVNAVIEELERTPNIVRLFNAFLESMNRNGDMNKISRESHEYLEAVTLASGGEPFEDFFRKIKQKWQAAKQSFQNKREKVVKQDIASQPYEDSRSFGD